MEWDFSANATIDEAALANVPEGYKGAYEKGEDGKYTISAGFKPYVDAIVGLGGALKAERNVSKTLKGQKDVAAAVKEALGFDTLDEAKAKLDELNQAVATASKVDPAKIKADIEKGFNATLATKDKELETMRGTLSRYMVDNAVIGSLAKHKGNETLLAPAIKAMVELVKDGDEYVVRVKDGQGDYRGNGKGGFMSVEELVAELKGSKEYGVAFESDAPSGTGTSQGQRRPGTTSAAPANRGDLTPMQMIEQGLSARR